MIFSLLSAVERRYCLPFPKHFHHFSSSFLCLRLVVYSNQAVVMSQLNLYWYAFLLCPGQFSSWDYLIWLFNYVKFRWLLLFRAEFSDAPNSTEFAAVHPAKKVHPGKKESLYSLWRKNICCNSSHISFATLTCIKM